MGWIGECPARLIEKGSVGEWDAESFSGLEMMCIESNEIIVAGVESPDSYSSCDMQQAPHFNSANFCKCLLYGKLCFSSYGIQR